ASVPDRPAGSPKAGRTVGGAVPSLRHVRRLPVHGRRPRSGEPGRGRGVDMGAYGSQARRGVHQAVRPGGERPQAPEFGLGPILSHYVDSFEWESARNAGTILCPVHGESRPSLTYDLEKGVFCCKACDARGTAISLIMKMESCDRASAVSRAEGI